MYWNELSDDCMCAYRASIYMCTICVCVCVERRRSGVARVHFLSFSPIPPYICRIWKRSRQNVLICFKAQGIAECWFRNKPNNPVPFDSWMVKLHADIKRVGSFGWKKVDIRLKRFGFWGKKWELSRFCLENKFSINVDFWRDMLMDRGNFSLSRDVNFELIF